MADTTEFKPELYMANTTEYTPQFYVEAVQADIHARMAEDDVATRARHLALAINTLRYLMNRTQEFDVVLMQDGPFKAHMEAYVSQPAIGEEIKYFKGISALDQLVLDRTIIKPNPVIGQQEPFHGDRNIFIAESAIVRAIGGRCCTLGLVEKPAMKLALA